MNYSKEDKEKMFNKRFICKLYGDFYELEYIKEHDWFNIYSIKTKRKISDWQRNYLFKMLDSPREGCEFVKFCKRSNIDGWK